MLSVLFMYGCLSGQFSIDFDVSRDKAEFLLDLSDQFEIRRTIESVSSLMQ